MAKKRARAEANLSVLFERVRNPATRDAAWPRVRDALRRDPGHVAPQLCSQVSGWLDAGEDVPTASLAICLEATTRDVPAAVPLDLLRRIVAEKKSDLVAVLAAAAMLVRVEPAGILTEGVDAVLAATDRALEGIGEDEDSRQYFRALATRLWRAVAKGDPPSIVAITEAWAGAGWERGSLRLLVELMVGAASDDPDLIQDSISVLEDIEKRHTGHSSPFDSPSSHLGKLNELRAAHRRRQTAQEAVAAIDVAQFRRKKSPKPAARPKAQPDPRVDRLIERYLTADEWRAHVRDAERRMSGMLKGTGTAPNARDIALLGSEPPDAELLSALASPWPALVDGVCELVNELLAAGQPDDRVSLLVGLVCRHPELVPHDVLRSWLRENRLSDSRTRCALYEAMAEVQPGWIVEHALSDGVAICMANGSHTLWRSLGAVYPELLVRFADQWLPRVGWDSKALSAITSGFEALARERPQHVAEMRRILDAHRGPPPEPGFISFKYIELSNAIERLDEIRRAQTV